MRINSIESDGFLSLDGFRLDALSTGLTVIVGPNGAGKTNLIRLLQAVRDALDINRREVWQDAFRVGADPAFTVKLALELTTGWERRLVTQFVLGSMAQTVIDAVSRFGWQPADQIERRLQWLDETRRQDVEVMLDGLFRGILEVSCAARPGPTWKVVYRFSTGDTPYEWLLDAWGESAGIARVEPASSRRTWQPPLHQIVSTAPVQDANQLLAGLGTLKVTWADVFPPGQRTVLGLRLAPRGGVPTLAQQLAVEVGEEFDVDGQPDQMLSGMRLFFHLLNHGIAFTENMRIPPREHVVAVDLTRQPESLNVGDGADLPLYLFRLKNGSGEQQRRYDTLRTDFQKLTGRRFDIRFEATPHANADNESTPNTGNVALRLMADVPGGEVPLRHAGAGLWEILILCAFRDKATEGVILALDEPATNVHPPLQHRILRLLRERRSQSIVITHSPQFIPTEDETDLMRLVRLYPAEGVTQVARLAGSVGGPFDTAKILKEMRRGTDVPALLFARGVILVEGETESGALPVWFAKSPTAVQHGTPDDHSVVFHSVNGARNLAKYVNFLQAFRIPWAVVCDGDQLKDPHFCAHFQPSASARVDAETDLAANQVADGVFTLSQADEFMKFEDLPYVREHLSRAAEEVGASKPRQGRYIAEETSCPDAVAKLYGALLSHFRLTS